ncbi:error-prone DNA polymerase [Dokdonella sp.]|uniref:error-prone DNA polymerase n=1 Tax=Dokdonella sp. TaxID=2291710 RepID=UPI0025C43275|nr:error-prone DNA polymerase [Dokdonella sp.]
MSPPPRPPAAYAELHCLSNFSFLRGASSAEELFARAKKLGYAALAITDECSLAGAVRALVAAESHGVQLIIGSELRVGDGLKLVLLACDASGYTDLCRLISRARRRSAKGSYALERADLAELGTGVLVLWLADARARSDQTEHLDEQARWLAARFRERLWIAVELHHGSDDAARLAALTTLGARHALPLVATGDVHMHLRRRRALQDALTATRLRCTLAQAGHALFANGERHLRRIEDLRALYPPALLAETLRIAALCRFSLRGLDYRYPDELVPAGRSAIEHLRVLTWQGAHALWPQAIPAAVHAQLERELLLIEQLRYEHFFLTVEDIVRWARTREPPILCQGRGSSANSAVCYCLGITAVTPENGNLLFERFLSKERDEPPDIDVDFEHERREDVIQYIYAKYGRERAALAATVIRYRGRSALRDIGRALGFADEQIALLTAALVHARGGGDLAAALRERGFDPDNRNVQRLFALADELRGFPRHLSQHVGGFVISQAPLHELVPVENAAMPARTIIQWDKDDLEEMRLLKVDVLALGMLSALRKCLALLHAHDLWTRPRLAAFPGLHDIPAPGADPSSTAVFDMICAADTVGVFQIESRAQMSMLPRLKPRNFHDLVVQIAIVRPGPIQGDMVHPYLRRRQGLEAVDYPQSRFERESGSEQCAVREVLARTLGVPIFQEQVMKLMQVVAGFTPGQADQLRRAMAAWKHAGDLEPFRDRIRAGMLERGYEEAYFERLFAQIRGFGAYGFPESHSASFANLAWASCWLKHFHPAAWTCALLNSQPMGFYAPAQLVQDARRHGVRVLPTDVDASHWDCTLQALPTSATPTPHAHALRLGLRQVKGIAEALAQRIITARAQAPFAHLADFCARACVSPTERARLADANALRSLSGHRHRARWDSAGIDLGAPLFAELPLAEARIELPVPSVREDVLGDYATLGLSLQAHPLALIRAQLRRRRVLRAADFNRATQTDLSVRCAGLVTVRQRPVTANGVTFVTIEDETGTVNVVIWQALAQRQTRILLEATILLVDGVLQLSGDGVRHLLARRLHDGSALLPDLCFDARDFH